MLVIFCWYLDKLSAHIFVHYTLKEMKLSLPLDLVNVRDLSQTKARLRSKFENAGWVGITTARRTRRGIITISFLHVDQFCENSHRRLSRCRECWGSSICNFNKVLCDQWSTSFCDRTACRYTLFDLCYDLTRLDMNCFL